MTALRSRALSRREESLKTLLASCEWSGNVRGPESVSRRTQAQSALSEWLKRAADAARACAAMEDGLEVYYLPDEARGGGRASIKDSFAGVGRVTDGDIVSALKAPVGRAKGLMDFVAAATAERSRAWREIEAGQ